MVDIFEDKSTMPGMIEQDLVVRTILMPADRTWSEAKMPGERKFPLDVRNLVRPPRGHHY